MVFSLLQMLLKTSQGSRDANPPAFGGIFPHLRQDPAFPGRMYIFPFFTI